MVPDKVKDIYRWAKYRARVQGLEFDIDLEDIHIPMFCPILNIQLQFNERVSGYNSPTLDRKDNTKGYTRDNIWVISNLANIMKSSASKDNLLDFADWVRKTYV